MTSVPTTEAVHALEAHVNDLFGRNKLLESVEEAAAEGAAAIAPSRMWRQSAVSAEMPPRDALSVGRPGRFRDLLE